MHFVTCETLERNVGQSLLFTMLLVCNTQLEIPLSILFNERSTCMALSLFIYSSVGISAGFVPHLRLYMLTLLG